MTPDYRLQPGAQLCRRSISNLRNFLTCIIISVCNCVSVKKKLKVKNH